MKISVDVSAVRHNIAVVRNRVNARLCAVVKAEAYGHGQTLCKYIEPDVDCFAVAVFSEAERLKALGIQKPILVLGRADENTRAADGIVPTAATADDVAFLRSRGVSTFNVKLNTGMNRYGCDGDELDKIIDTCGDMRIFSAFTHYYDGEDPEAVRAQSERFDAMTAGRELGLRHCCASNCLYTQNRYDMVRCGIALYGYGSGSTDLMPAMTVTAEIMQLRRVRAGEHIGYGVFTAPRDCLVATVRAGYGDGYRRLTAPRQVSVEGRLCPVLGQICMDAAMIDVTEVPRVREGEAVYLLGRGVTGEMLAASYGTIVYEVLTAFHSRGDIVYERTEESTAGDVRRNPQKP